MKSNPDSLEIEFNNCEFKNIPIDFNLSQTLFSGQPPHFIWNTFEKENGVSVFYRKFNSKYWFLYQEDSKTYTNQEFYFNSLDLFRFNDDYSKIRKSLRKDDTLSLAIDKFPNLRLTKSDFWESTVCYICSANNNIGRIKKIVGSLFDDQGQITINPLLSTSFLKSKGLGYRAEYLSDTALKWSNGQFDINKVKTLNHQQAKNELIKLKGIGPKVADCISLYGLGNTDSFPIDIWVQRAMTQFYGLTNHKQIQ